MKRVLMLLLVMVLTVGMLSMTAYAAGGASLSISSATVNRGNDVSVNVSITSNPGFSYAMLTVNYDTSALQLNSISPAAGWVVYGKNAQFNSSTGDSTQTGNILTLNFTVLDTAAKGNYSVSVTAEANNWDEEDVVFAVSAGSIAVTVPPCPNNAHDWDWDESKCTSPTCTKPGITVGTCKICGTYFEGTAAALGHEPGEWTVSKEASCSETGLKIKVCGRCSETVETETIAKLAHTEGEWEVTKAATCTEKGTKAMKCTVCKNVIKTGTIDATGHTPGAESVITKQPTCEETGLMEGKCATCGETLDTTEIKALGHEWNAGSVTKAPSCEFEGLKTYTCTRDSKHTKTEKITPIGHKWDEGKVTTDPTCTEKGVKTFTCANDASHTKTEDVAALGHTADENSVRVEPTCTEDGSITGKCAVCKVDLDKETIPALGHDLDDGTVTVPVTCEKDGTMTYACKRDGCDYTETKTIKHTGHGKPDWKVDEEMHYGNCPDCGEKLDGKHDYRHEGGKVNGKREWLCECGEAIYKSLPSNSADLDDVPKTGDITVQVVTFIVCAMAAVMAFVVTTKRKSVK